VSLEGYLYRLRFRRLIRNAPTTAAIRATRTARTMPMTAPVETALDLSSGETMGSAVEEEVAVVEVKVQGGVVGWSVDDKVVRV